MSNNWKQHTQHRTVTVHRKWWQFWKPESYNVTVHFSVWHTGPTYQPVASVSYGAVK